MKKTFSLRASNREPARQVEYVKHQIKKYIDREKRKPFPEGVDYWDFDCKFGPTEDAAEIIFLNEIRPSIDSLVKEEKTSFYVEILVKQGVKKIKKEAGPSGQE